MSFLINLCLVNLLLLCVVVLALRYGDEDGDGVLDIVARIFKSRIPGFLRNSAHLLLGAQIASRIEAVLSYVAYERNPITMILYLTLCIGGYVAFVFSGYGYLPNATLDFPYHKEAGFILFCLSLYFFLQSASKNPGIITKSNHSAMMMLYPFDGRVFRKNCICPTCRVQKPARSKHCRVCNLEVTRFDHHCIWINQCVGLGNIKEFLLFLLFNNMMCLYGGYLGVGILMDIAKSEDLMNSWFRDSLTGQRYKASLYYVFIYLMGRETILVYMTILCLFIGSFLLFFTWYHWVTLIRSGITTNEDDKLRYLTNEERLLFSKTYSAGSWSGNLRSLWQIQGPPLDVYRKR
jgi:hypothetical protein